MMIFGMILISWLANATADSEQIRSTIRNHIVEVRKCYEKELGKKSKEGKDIKGKLVVVFDINELGKVEKAEVKKEATDLNDQKVIQCILTALKSWDFPKAPKGDVHRIIYPFVFSAE